MLWIIIAITISYLIGSIPTAYIFVRWLKGADIRKIGSGNVGATNALRILGKGLGLLVLVLDILKGFIAVFFLGNLIAPKVTLAQDETLRILLGLSCISGHNWTIFLNFKGGKGVATTLGVLAALAVQIKLFRLILALTILTWLLIFLIFRIVSLASVLAGIALPIYTIIFKQSVILIFSAFILCAFILLRHRSNLIRLFQGKEPRQTFGKTK
jgi:glycerol-3-phosphate acyltransferase PlsY